MFTKAKTSLVQITFITLFITLLFFNFTSQLNAATTDDEQIRAEKLQQIQTLLAMIEQLKAQQANSQTVGAQSCLKITHTLSLDSTDRETNGEVSILQKFLTKTNHYTYGKITGYYGKETMNAVQRWQAANSIVKSGNPSTTGYGSVGQKTKEALNRNCLNTQDTDLLPGKEVDGILKSTNKGSTFDSHFKIVTDEDIKTVDVLTVSFHPKVKDNITVSTYDNGLFTKQSPFNQWNSVYFPPKQIFSFILDKEDPNNRVFATGVNGRNGRIYKTEDRGTTWQSIYAEPGDGTTVSAITQIPKKPKIIIAGTSGGTLLRSTDSGNTWMNIGQTIRGKINHFTHDATKDSMVYLLSQSTIYHSNDSGSTWKNWEDIKKSEIDQLRKDAAEANKAGDKERAKKINDKITELNKKNSTQKTPSGIVRIVADPSKSGVIYAGLSSGLYRSTDYGKYWEKINIIESAERFSIPSIAINPNNSNEISFVAGNSFYRSTNYGSTWSVTPLNKTKNASFVAYDPHNTSNIYIGLSKK